MSLCMYGKLAIYQPLHSSLWAVLGCMVSSPFHTCLWDSLGHLACTLKLGYISFSMTVLLPLAAVFLWLWLNLPGEAFLFMTANNTQVMKKTPGSIKQGSAREEKGTSRYSATVFLETTDHLDVPCIFATTARSKGAKVLFFHLVLNWGLPMNYDKKNKGLAFCLNTALGPPWRQCWLPAKPHETFCCWW